FIPFLSYLFLLFITLLRLEIIDNTGKVFHFFSHQYVASILIILLFFKEISYEISKLLRLNFNPSLILIYSFITIILIGTAFLLFPRATTNGISFVDALFTATSATCVTGLAVLDT